MSLLLLFRDFGDVVAAPAPPPAFVGVQTGAGGGGHVGALTGGFAREKKFLRSLEGWLKATVAGKNPAPPPTEALQSVAADPQSLRVVNEALTRALSRKLDTAERVAVQALQVRLAEVEAEEDAVVVLLLLH